MRLKSFLLSAFLIVLLNLSFAQTQSDTMLIKKEITKSGLNFGVLPSVLFNTDLGFQYGGIIDLFHYGDGSKYPKYNYEVYGEWSRTTKGGGVNQLYLDVQEPFGSKFRFQMDVSYLTQMAMDFYGFNGYRTKFNHDYVAKHSSDYISRMFYKYEKKLLRACFILRGPTAIDNLFWLGGFGFYSIETGSVNIGKLNKGLMDRDILPDTCSLYSNYVDWGIIPENERHGGKIKMARVGLSYDTRDNYSNPMKGVWTEIICATVPSFFGNIDATYTKLAISHRQYFTIVPNDLSFAYRIAWQGVVDGHEPWYMHSYMIYSSPETTTIDGLGGTKTLRGILRDRVVGDGVAYANLELRWKAVRFVFLKQNVYLGLHAFSDMGMVVDETDVDLSNVPQAEYSNFFSDKQESLHASLGGGFTVVMNRNFVVAVNYGRALDLQDGKDGFYMGLNYLF